MSSKKYNWDEIISNFQQSQLSQAEYCRQNQLNAKYLSLQLRKRNLTNPNKTKSSFIKATKPKSHNSQNPIVTIEYQSAKIKIEQPNSKWLAEFCQVLNS